MSTRACFIIFALCYKTLTFAFNNGEQVRHLVAEVCQFTNFCHTVARKINLTEYSIPCCLPCSCDDDCWELDNCCPDKKLINGKRLPILPCRDSYVKPPNGNSKFFRGFYRVIDSCPSSEDRSNLNYKCSTENKTSLEDFVWVSDKTGKIYQNMHCAECHRVKEKIPWQIATTCYDIMKANFGNFKETLLSEECIIVNTPPEDLKTVSEKYTCINPNKLLYSSCNETGLMAHYDPDVETACKQSTWPYILHAVYLAKNVFCVICNQEIPTFNLDGLCANAFEDRLSGGLALTFLIDYSSLSVDTLEETNCGLDELFDEFMGLCRKLRCPIGTAPLHGRCKQLVSKLIGLVIRVHFYLDITWNQTSLFTAYGQDKIGEEILTRLIQLMDLNLNCHFCEKRLDFTEENSTSALALIVSLKIELGCDFGLLLTKLADMRDKAIEIDINRTTILTLLFRSDKKTSTEHTEQRCMYDNVGPQTIFSRYFCSCARFHWLSFDDMTCPRLEISYKELELLSPNEIKKRDAFASFFISNGTEQDLTRVSVCLDTYISVMSQLNDAWQTDGKMVILFLPTVLYMCSLTLCEQGTLQVLLF